MLEQAGVEVPERSTGKEPLGEQEVRDLLGKVERVVIARGRNRGELKASEVEPKDLLGPTGNVRAPLVHLGDTLVVGLDLDSVTALIAAG